MQRRLRMSRKSAHTMMQKGEKLQIDTKSFQCDQQSTAKNMLIQLAQSQYEPIEERRSFQKTEAQKLNEWFKTETKSSKRQLLTPTRKTKYLRRTVHIRPFAQIKLLNKYVQSDENLEQSIIPHLKLQLRKLESPQKKRQLQQKKKKMEYLEQKFKRKKDLVLVEELIESKRHSVRTKKIQSENKPDSLMFFTNFSQGKARHIFQQRNTNQIKDTNQQVYMIKEARKHRTLKNLLL